MYAACGMREDMVPSPLRHSCCATDRASTPFESLNSAELSARAGAMAAALPSARRSNGTAPWTASIGRRAVRLARCAAFHSLCREQMLCQRERHSGVILQRISAVARDTGERAVARRPALFKGHAIRMLRAVGWQQSMHAVRVWQPLRYSAENLQKKC